MDRASTSSNAAHHLVERHLLVGRGCEPAVLDDSGRWTFAALAGASAVAAGALRARGVAAGDRVIVALPDGREAVAALVGAMRLGAIAVPVDPGASREHRAAVAADCAPRLVVDLPERLAAGPALPPLPVRPHDPALIVYTSGSTGRPKGVVHAHCTFSPGNPSFLRGVLGAGPGDRCMAASRLATALGFFLGLARPLTAGATAVLSAAPAAPRRTLEHVARHDVSVLSAVPMHWAQIACVLRRCERADGLGGVRAAVSSGDRLPAALATQMQALGVPLIDALGASECGDVYLSGPGGGSLDRVTPGVEIAPGPGDAGPLRVRTSCAALGYWGRPELTARLRGGGEDWTRTEDVVAHEAGGVRLLGRADDLFKVGGRLVSPLEIERALGEHPRVREAAVVGAERRGRTRPAAFVVAEDPADGAGLADELRRHVARRLAPDLAPARVALMEALPRLAGGKLDRRALVAAVAAA